MNKFALIVSVCALAVCAQAQEPDARQNESVSTTKAQQTQSPPPSADADKKMVREANINLQTTVTGNQEQPRVMYILPWQSPLSPELEMEMMSSQEEAVFGHVERDELARALEAAGEFDSAGE
ncbi:MAG TPA: hypothetical protein VLF09_16525 [Cellvibrio sp.]|nr:hypothetical protein [Cellvibrio sp.]